ncbi:uncharacterized protein Bfra_006154 [Botrytis fragariae]|uniref:Uncharacterized protein n=1 Tax=Botrytis fragariae TaxID=1964551 RepID=A0A8H6EHW3_9HELO|nr:uncharacterized protein Bfra_006154 [Botrytis fragariae]KAF5872791.1 hypothetical protein Bfra_006154 [Botrytis fragariae]
MANFQYELSSLPEREAHSTSPVSSMGNSRRSFDRDQDNATSSTREPSSILHNDNVAGVQISERTLNRFDHNSTTSLHHEDPPAYTISPEISQVKSYTLKRNWGGFWLSLIFSTLILLQWIGLVHICYKPFGSSYSYEITAATRKYDFKWNERWLNTFQVLITICSLFVLIVVSTILSRAAVVFTQRRNSKPGYTLSQIIAIADEIWLSIPAIWKCSIQKDMKLMKSGYLLYAFSLCISAILIYPIQQGFLQIFDIYVPNPQYPSQGYFHNMYRYNYPLLNGENILYDLYTSHGYQGALSTALVNTNPNDIQPNLWNPSNSSSSYPIGRPSTNISAGLQERLSNSSTSWYAIQNNTYSNGMYNSTGLRMNTSITCFIIPQREFPTVCPGPSPWTTSINLTTANNTMTIEYIAYGINGLILNACVPGNKYAFPWSVNSTLQTIEEELYFDIGWTMTDIGHELTGIGSLQNYTQKCTADTTFGYFNLPTYANSSAGPLLPADIPIFGAIASETTPRTIFNESDPLVGLYSAINRMTLDYHGPLLTSALALFPDWSSMTDEYGGIDQRLNIQWPLSKFTGSINQNESYASYLSRFAANQNYLENSLRISTFLATKTAWEVVAENLNYRAHPLFTEMGKTVKRPYLPLSVIIIVSILIIYLTLSLLYLGIRSAFNRTWTTTLNSLSMILLTRDAAERMPKLPVILHGSTGNEGKLVKSLADEPAVIGDIMVGDKVGTLAVGGEGIIGVAGRRYRDGRVEGPVMA